MKANLPLRRLIPKWRPVSATLEKAEAISLEKRKTHPLFGDPEELEKAVKLWRETKAPGALGDVLSFSVHPDLVATVRDIGREAIRSGAKVSNIQNSHIADLGQEESAIQLLPAFGFGDVGIVHPFQAPVRRLRALLRTTPANALALLDYAQLQAALGKREAAEKSIVTALGLSPNNRTVIRTAARFYVHTDDPTKAHYLVRKHCKTAEDPWLMASEIALADVAKVDSVFLSRGKRFLFEQKNLSTSHITELAGVVASQELRSGNLKKARESQRKALLAPNDNVMAQAIELENFFGIALDTPAVLGAISRSSEALVLQAWGDLEPESAEKYLLKWHDEEPFSSRPIQLISTLYLYKGSLELASRWILAGLVTDPKDKGLLINLAFAQARRGLLNESTTTIKKLKHLHPEVEPFVKATEGLISYKRGNFEMGDALYEESLSLFLKGHKPDVATYCRVNQAVMAGEENHPAYEDIVAKAKVAVTEHPSFDALMMIKAAMQPALPLPEVESPQQRRLSHWVFDPNTNSITNVPGVTAIGAKGLIVLDKKQ